MREYVDQAIAGLKEGYHADSPEWNAAVAEARPHLYSAETFPGTYRLLSKLTKVAGGAYSFFSTPGGCRRVEAAIPAGPGASSHGERRQLRSDGSHPRLLRAHQSDIDRCLEAATEIFTSRRAHFTCGWVIDVTANTGGGMRSMLVALSPSSTMASRAP